jgi:hypothetical protein
VFGGYHRGLGADSIDERTIVESLIRFQARRAGVIVFVTFREIITVLARKWPVFPPVFLAMPVNSTT